MGVREDMREITDRQCLSIRESAVSGRGAVHKRKHRCGLNFKA